MAEDKPPETTPDPKAEAERLANENRLLRERNQRLEAAYVSPEYLGYLESKRAEASKPKPAATEEVDDKALDDLPPSQAVKIIVKRAEKAGEAAAEKAFQERVAPHIDRQEYREANREVEQARALFEDFDTYKPAMIRLAETHPTLKAKDLYVLACGEAGKAPKPRSKVSAVAEAEESERTSPKPEKEKPATGEGPGAPPGARTRAARTNEPVFQKSFEKAWKSSGMQETHGG